MFRRVHTLVMTTLLTLISGAAMAEQFGGVEFPLGAISFADGVVDFTAGSASIPPYDDPSRGLGVPDYDGTEDTYFAIGESGVVVFEFTDNLLVDQSIVENGNDLYIFEIGPIVEAFDVAISADGLDYIEVGRVSGQPTGLDIAPFVQSGDAFRFVRLTDDGDGSSGSPFAGADIDAVGAIGSIAVPEPTAMLLSLVAACGMFARVRGR